MSPNESIPTLEAPLAGESASGVQATSAPETQSETLTPIPNISFEDLQRVVHILARSQKFRLLQFIVADLAEYEKPQIPFPKEAPIWTPLGAFEAAAVMARVVEKQEDL